MIRRAAALALMLILAAPVLAAEDMPVFHIVLKDGSISPTRLVVPAGKPFKLQISNTGTTPAEFESQSLHKERVLAAGATSSLVFRRLEAGEYDFFDDFHPSARAVLVAQ